MGSSGGIPVSIIGGFLGSGKTTLLNRLLAAAAGRRLGLIVNDFGDINIDEKLIVARDEEMISLANGCICCSIGNDFLRALIALVSRPDPPEQIFIEASGVADPARISAIAQADRDLALQSVVVLVDVLNFCQQLADPLLADTVEGQVRSGDLLVLTKSDVATEQDIEAVEEAVQEIVSTRRVIVSPVGDLPVDLLFDLQCGVTTPIVVDHAHNHPFWTGVFEGRQACDVERLQSVLQKLPESVLRLKGFVRDREGRSHVVQCVAGRANVEPEGEDVRLARANELVYIGVGVDEEERDLQSLLASAFVG
jgi:G3E family GTPase